MAYTLTYDTLYNSILAYLERNDQNLRDAIPGFIFLGQRRITNDLKSLVSEQYVVGNMTAGSAVIQKPAGWVNTITFNFGIGDSNNTRKQLLLRTYEYCTNYWPNDTLTGEPEFFSDYGYNNFRITPTPDENYPFELCFLGVPPMIDSENQTNIITDRVPHLLEFACLEEAMIFIKDDERIQFFNQKYVGALQSLQNEDQLRYADRATNRSIAS